MHNGCVLVAYNLGKTMCTSNKFCTVICCDLIKLFKASTYTQLFKPLTRIVVHVKISLNGSVKRKLSTVSTPPTTKTTTLKFNDLLIYNQGAI
jgi:hypothetical protein